MLFAGCGRSAFFGFTNSTTYKEALDHTKKGEINDKFETKALISASYLSLIYPNDERYSKTESFLVGLYIANDYEDNKAGINNPSYKLTLNDKPFVASTLLNKDDPLLKSMPLINRWSKYYIVEFELSNTSAQTLTLLEFDTNQSTAMKFVK